MNEQCLESKCCEIKYSTCCNAIIEFKHDNNKTCVYTYGNYDIKQTILRNFINDKNVLLTSVEFENESKK